MNDQRPREPFERGPDDDPTLGALIEAAGARRSVPSLRAERVRQHVHRAWQKQVRRRKRRRLGWVAAIAALALFGALGLWRVGNQDEPIGRLVGSHGNATAIANVLQRGAVIETDARSGARFALTGGAALRIDASTRLVFASQQSARLEFGRIYVEGSPGEQALPLTVETRFGSITEVGTQFEIDCSLERLRVRVREGAVLIRARARETKLAWGTQWSLDAHGTVVQNEVPSYDASWDWIYALAPRFRLEGATLAQFLEWSARERGLRLSYALPQTSVAAQNTRLHGDAQGLDPAALSATVLAATGFAGTSPEPGVWIISQ
jgi:ferric-dicitrate binding protein FerR (iron transport regulator)